MWRCLIRNEGWSEKTQNYSLCLLEAGEDISCIRHCMVEHVLQRFLPEIETRMRECKTLFCFTSTQFCWLSSTAALLHREPLALCFTKAQTLDQTLMGSVTTLQQKSKLEWDPDKKPSAWPATRYGLWLPEIGVRMRLVLRFRLETHGLDVGCLWSPLLSRNEGWSEKEEKGSLLQNQHQEVVCRWKRILDYRSIAQRNWACLVSDSEHA